MNFENGHLYHLYNQGNNRQRIFFSRENYLFFLTKIRDYILPHADVLAWCLMPNHFHMMIYVHNVEVIVSDGAQYNGATERVTLSHPLSKNAKMRNLNDSIAILLRSYTRAINKQENRSGALFREGTKAECLTKFQGTTPAYFNTAFGALINVRIPEQEYPQVCFNYIHQNPLKAKLAKKPEDWEFSSYPDYFGGRKGKLIGIFQRFLHKSN